MPNHHCSLSKQANYWSTKGKSLVICSVSANFLLFLARKEVLQIWTSQSVSVCCCFKSPRQLAAQTIHNCYIRNSSHNSSLYLHKKTADTGLWLSHWPILGPLIKHTKVVKIHSNCALKCSVKEAHVSLKCWHPQGLVLVFIHNQCLHVDKLLFRNMHLFCHLFSNITMSTVVYTKEGEASCLVLPVTHTIMYSMSDAGCF